jgi:hypothetical protein
MIEENSSDTNLSFGRLERTARTGRSLFNLLDLGAWIRLQSAVEKLFRGTRNDQQALARGDEETWIAYDSTVFP